MIPDARDLASVARVVDRFLEIQGASFTGGLVFRAHADLARSAASGEAEEWRAFSLDGEPVGVWHRTVDAAAFGPPPTDLVREVCRALPTRFRSVNRHDGWFLIEVGDGQVSELPAADAGEVLAPLMRRLAKGLQPGIGIPDRRQRP